jgi:xanthine/uracil permease
MSNKVSIIIYALAMVAGLVNAFVNFKSGNVEATIGWICASGMAGGALGAYLKLRDIEKEN